MGRQVIVQTSPHLRNLYVGTSIGNTWPIIETVPGSPVTVIEFPEGTTDAQQAEYLADLHARNLIVPQDDGSLSRDIIGGYKPMGVVHTDAEVLFAPGDTFPIVGVSSETQRRGNWGASVRIGHVDTGCDFSHPWFDGKDLGGDNGDTVGHGTFCAGIMVGSQGIASDASLLEKAALRSGTGTEVDIARGIRECAEAGCQVINLSLGGSPSTLMDAACRYASQLGAIVVAAAGNTANSAIGSPAQASDVIVLAIDRDHNYASFTSGTNWKNTNRAAAPGVNDVSAAPGGGTTQGSGTSFAAPHASAMLALLRASGLSRGEALAYFFAHRTDNPDKLTPVLTTDFGKDNVGDGGGPWLAQVGEDLDLIDDLVERAQLDRCDWDADYDAYRSSMATICDKDIGPIKDVVAMIRAALPSPPDPAPVPVPPPPPPSTQFALPISDGAVYGKTKWLPGSLGCDMFVARNSPVYAPDDCLIEEVLGGTGLTGGDEIILAKRDKSWAWRYRHTTASVRTGDQVSRGGLVGRVYDASMDALGHTPPGFPAPDNYQHLDLSVNKGSDQFSPQGGGGGNYPSYQWLQDQGYKGTVVSKTPGPNDASPFVESGRTGDGPVQSPPKRGRPKRAEASPGSPSGKSGAKSRPTTPYKPRG